MGLPHDHSITSAAFPLELKARLDALSAVVGRSRSCILRRAFALLLERPDAADPGLYRERTGKFRGGQP